MDGLCAVPRFMAATKHGPPMSSAPALDLWILFILFILSKTCTGSCLVGVFKGERKVNQTRSGWNQTGRA